MKNEGYRLHWEGSIEEPLQFYTMKQVNREIYSRAQEAGIAFKKAQKYAYVITENEFMKEVTP